MPNRKLAVILLVTAGIWLPLEPTPFFVHSFERPSVTGRAHAGEIPAEGRWEGEFNHICAQIPLATTLSTEELQRLVERCDAIRPAIEALKETPRKIYLKRLEKAKSLYLFVIETRNRPTP